MVLKKLYTQITSKIFPIVWGSRAVEKKEEEKIRKLTKHVFKKYDEITVRLSYE